MRQGGHGHGTASERAATFARYGAALVSAWRRGGEGEGGDGAGVTFGPDLAGDGPAMSPGLQTETKNNPSREGDECSNPREYSKVRRSTMP